jgi:MFS transporter, DHA2 family, multidrug resistance protein
VARRPSDPSGSVRGEIPAPVANRAAITISIMLAPIMQGVDTTIANVALPHMQGSLSVAQDQIAWVLTSYIVAAAIMTPLTGWLAGRFGIKYSSWRESACFPQLHGRFKKAYRDPG